jgi:type III secretion system YscQ/HrcQ family protein
VSARVLDARRAQPPRWHLLAKVARPIARTLTMFAAHARPADDAAATARLAALLGDPAPAWTVDPPYAFARAELAGRLAHAPWLALRVRRPDGRCAAVVVDGVLAVALAGRALGASAELPAPRAVSAAETGVLVALAAAWLDARATPGLVVEGWTADAAALAGWLSEAWIIGVDVRVRLGAASGVVRVLAPESLVAASPPAATLTLGRLADVRVRLPIEAGRAALAAAEVRALAPGDVVVLDAAARGRATLRAGRVAWPVTTDDARLAVAGAAVIGEETMSGGDDLARDLPVSLSCRLGQLELTLADLAALGPGAVVGLGRPLGAPVELCAGDRVVARGELVDVDGELGVRVTAVLR